MRKVFSILALLLMAVTGATAQTESLLVTINSQGNDSFTSGSQTFNNIATVTFSGSVYNDNDDDGWYWYDPGSGPGSGTSVTMSVTPAEGYTITKVKFYCIQGSAFDETAPFEARLDGSGLETYVNGSSIGMVGVNKIEVYGYATPANTPVTGATLSPTEASLTAGGAALELTPTVAPEGATDTTVTWSVEQEGSIVALYTDQACTQAVGTDAIAAAKVYVKPLAAGQATVTVTTNDGAMTATCTVSVAPAVPQQYRLDSIPQGWEVKVNDTLMGSDTLKTYTDGGNPQMRYIAAINETDSVELVPPAELRGTIKAVRLTESVAPAPVEPITVTWNKSDITGTSYDSFTKDGVTVTCQMIDFENKNFMNAGSNTGTFTTTLGNFTKIEVTAMNNVSGTGWTGSSTAKTWEGDAASSVSFQGSIKGYQGLTIVFTIQPNN